MKSMRRVSSNAGLGADCSRVATCGVGGSVGYVARPATPTALPCHLRVRCSCRARPYLLVVGSDQAEDEASVRQGQQIAEEEGQAGVEALGQLRVLGAQGLSARAHVSHRASVSTLGHQGPPGPASLHHGLGAS